MLLIGQIKLTHEFRKISDRHVCDLVNVHVRNGNGQEFLFKSLSVTHITRSDRHERFVFRFRSLRKRLAISHLAQFDDTLERNLVIASASLAYVAYHELFSVVTMPENIFYFFGIILKRGIHVKTVFLAKSYHSRMKPALVVIHGLKAVDHYGTFV